MIYRREIDGLRALAVVPVVLFHAGFNWFEGGFTGVDVFFVISGYLITTICIDDIESKSFSITTFYNRRARRILPALFVVMLACIPFAWMFMLPTELNDFSRSLVAASLFLSNILFWRESGYFDAVSEEKPLLHTWSLAVEGQFYLLFPVFFILAWRLDKNRLLKLLIGITAISFLLSEWGSHNKAVANFYLAPTRFWELLAGSITAFVAKQGFYGRNDFFAFLGLVIIAIPITVYDKSIPFPGFYAVPTVLGTMFVLIFATSGTLVARLLSNRVLVGIGAISYSLYLWHQPVFAFGRIIYLDQPGPSVMLSLILISVVLSYLSWRYIELRVSKNQETIIYSLAKVGMIFLLSLGTIGYLNSDVLRSGQFHAHGPLYNLQFGAYIADNRKLQSYSWSILRAKADDESYAVSNNAFDQKMWFGESDARKNILLVGNSHSKDLYNVMFYNKKLRERYQIARFGTQIRDLLEEESFWQSKNYLAAGNILIVSRYTEDDVAVLPKVIERMLVDGKEIFLVKSIFEFPAKSPKLSLIDEIVLENLNSRLDVLSNKINMRYYDLFQSTEDNITTSINKKIMRIADQNEVVVLDRMDYVCDADLALCYAVQANLSKNFYDYGHHTLAGARFFGTHERFEKFLEPIDKELSP